MKTLALLLAATQAQPAPQPAPAPAAAPDYAEDSAWLCLPGRADACGQPLPTVALNPNGYGSTGAPTPAADTRADCFYVYPTVSRDPGIVSDLTPGIEEQAAAYTQAARFGSVCRVFAPMYRQLTLAALARANAGGDQAEIGRAFVLAYDDVKAAWAQFLASHNRDRPFVLIGHSQGSIHLQRLIQEEVDGKPIAARMLSAILLGWNVEVPEGRLVGGSFRTTPLCSRVGETGCVITYVTFRTDAPPPEGALFGRAATPGRTVGCTNPATLGAGPAQLDSYWFAGRPEPTPIRWSSEGAPSVPFVRTEGLVTGECVHDGQVGYLALSVPPTPEDKRTDRVPGDVVIGGVRAAGWGTHLADMAVAQGDLVRLVEAQVAGR